MKIREHDNNQTKDPGVLGAGETPLGGQLAPNDDLRRHSAHDIQLTSWKEIASHLGRVVRTVQRWEEEEGLPVYRHIHTRGGTVYAFASELSAWQKGRTRRLRRENGGAPQLFSAPSIHVGLGEKDLCAATCRILGLLLLRLGKSPSTSVTSSAPEGRAQCARNSFSRLSS